MALKRLHISLSGAQFRLLEKLALKLGLDKSSTISYCLARVAEQESLNSAGRDASANKKVKRGTKVINIQQNSYKLWSFPHW